MKPKTKLQMEIVNGSRKLAPVSEAQKRYAYKHCFAVSYTHLTLPTKLEV